MKLKLESGRLRNGLWSARKAAVMAAAAALSLTMASAIPAQIAMKFCINGNGGLQSGADGALAPTDVAGAFPQTNWNTLGRYGDSTGSFNLVDSTGTTNGIIVNWDSVDTWSQAGGGTPTPQATPDGNVMNAFLDSDGNADVALGTSVFGSPNADKPLIYISGIQAWLATQSASYYDVVLYSDGDGTDGRVGEFWLQDASGPTSGLTIGSDITTHTFICDDANFITTGLYAQVPATINTGTLSQQGNFPGNYTVFASLTNDSFLVRSAEFNFRSPINAMQIIPRTAPLAAVVDPLLPSKVYTGGTAAFRATVAGVTPMSFQWLKDGAAISDVGNRSGTATSTLIISNATALDVGSYSLVVSNAIGTVTTPAAALTLTNPVAGSYAEKIFTNGPVAYWRLNDTGDPTTDYAVAQDVAGGFNGIYQIAAQNSFNGIAGLQPPAFPGFEANNAALQVGGNVAHSWVVAPPLNLNTNTVTITAWIYPTGVNQLGSAGIVMERNGGDVSGLDYQNGANQLGYTWNGQGYSYNYQSGLIVPSNMWSFVALAVTPTNATLYLYNANGQSQATTTTTNLNANAAFSGYTLIGCDPADGGAPQGRAFTGSIDEVAVYGRVLPTLEIYNIYKKGLGLSAIPAVVSASPVSEALYAGRTANFTVTASGDSPITYQWRTNGVILAGATDATLSIPNVNAANVASYDVVVSNIANTAGPAISSAATLAVVAPPAVLSKYEAALQAANPLHYWRFSEGVGSSFAYDYWGGNIATNDNSGGGVTTGVPGPQPPTFPGLESTNTGIAYDGFTGATETGLAGLNNNVAAFTIMGWFNTAGVEPVRTGLFGQNDVIEFGFHGVDASGEAQLGVYTAGGGSAFLPQTLITAGQWYFVAATGDANTVNLYLLSSDGAGGYKVSQATGAVATTNYGSSTYSFNIGGDGVLDVTGNYFDGSMDEVAVFHRALSLDELSGLFAAGLGVTALAPQITSQPAAQALYAGRTAQFSVTAVGSGTLGYQWRTNSVAVPDGGNVSGAKTSTLTIANLTAADNETIDVVVSNTAGATNSIPVQLTVVTPPSGGYESTVLALNPLAYYRLNETSGTTANDYWGGHAGTYESGATLDVPGPQAPTYVGFETNNSGVQVSVSANSWVTAPFGSLATNTVTMSMWIYPTATPDTYAGLLATRGGGVEGGFGYTGGDIGYTWNNNSGATYGFVSGLVPPLNEWSFVALALSPSNAVLYMFNTNGQASATNVLAHTSDVFGNNWQIGSDNADGLNDGARNFIGSIDEVAVFTHTLTGAQIQSLYATGAEGPQISLNIAVSGQNLVLTWTQGTLQESVNVNGPWTATASASSPFTVTPSGAQKFYRLKVH